MKKRNLIFVRIGKEIKLRHSLRGDTEVCVGIDGEDGELVWMNRQVVAPGVFTTLDQGRGNLMDERGA